LVIVAILGPEVDSARRAARRAICTINLRQHSGAHADTVYLDRGRIVRVWSCWCCGSWPGIQIYFAEERNGELLPTEQALREGFPVLTEAIVRLRLYKLDRGETCPWFRHNSRLPPEESP
jgi:hypothetical protein